MTTLKTNAIEPEGATTNLVIGESGQNTVIRNLIRANVLQDSGGNAIFTSDGSGNMSGVDSQLGSAMILLSTQVATGNPASIEFTSAITGAFTSTYKEYVFKWFDCNPSSNGQNIYFDTSTDGGSSYSSVKTSSGFNASHTEGGTSPVLENFHGNYRLENTAGGQHIGEGVGGGADENCAGELHIINPAGTTYAKHYYGISAVQEAYGGSASGTIWWSSRFHGYVNSTANIDAVKFYWGGGTHDSGTFKMWGIK